MSGAQPGHWVGWIEIVDSDPSSMSTEVAAHQVAKVAARRAGRPVPPPMMQSPKVRLCARPSGSGVTRNRDDAAGYMTRDAALAAADAQARFPDTRRGTEFVIDPPGQE